MSRRRSFASLPGALLLVLGAGAACAACGRTETRGDVSPPDAALTLTPLADAGTRAEAGVDAHADAGATTDASAAQLEADAPFLTGVPTSAKAIGHTSIVFKLELSTGRKAAFKPASRRGPQRYKGEIAARRLALALGLESVPPAFFRSFEARLLGGAKGADEMIVSGGVVKGALIPWIPDLGFLALEQAPMSGQWKQWLRTGTAIPDDKRGLAAQISTLVAFDYLTANWDRWSGGNVGVDKATGSLLYIDNDGAFFELPPQEGLERNKKLLAGIDRFARGFITRVRLLDDAELARALGDETPGVALLSAKALAGVSRRRKELLEVVDAKAAAEETTLAFP